jgi:hypothetical protein
MNTNTNTNITSAKYVATDGVNHTLECVINGNTCGVPLDLANRHYAEIMHLVDAGELTIDDAD